MAKKIIRELIIMLLLCLAVILLLGVVLYAYVPGNKTMPEKVSYVVPAEIKKELESESVTQNSQVILTYEIDSNDLTNYQRIKDYNPGKPNPFSSFEKEEDQAQTTTSANSTTTNSGTTTTNTTGNNNSNSNTTNTTKTNTNSETSSSSESETNTSPYVNDKGTK